MEATRVEDVEDEVAPAAGVEAAGFSGATGFEVSATALLVVCLTGWGAVG